MIIYKVTNIVNHKCYIGLTVNSLKTRKRQHLSIKYSGTSILVNAIRKYGKNCFIFEQIDSASTEAELIEKEKFWIKELNTIRPNGYNVLSGHVAGEELARSRSIPVFCLEDGKEYSSLSDAARSYGVPPLSVWSACNGKTDFAGQFSFRYVDKAKYAKAEIKRTKRKSNATRGYATGAKKHNRRVKCVTTGEIFESVKAAAIALNIDSSQIVRVCKGKNNHVKRLIFVYL